MKNYYETHKKTVFTILALFSPTFWYLFGIMLGAGGGAIAVCIISGILTTVYFGLRAGHLWGWFED